MFYADKMSTIFNYLTKIAHVYPNLEKQLVLLSQMSKAVIDADRATVWLHDSEKKQLWSKIADGVGVLRIPEDQGMVGHVLKTGQYYLTNNAQQDQFYSHTISKSTNYETLSALSMPLKDSQGVTFGVFQLINKLEGLFDEEDIESLSMIANYCEQALTNSMLHEELENTQRDILFALSSAGEARSNETAFHVKRVSKISKLLGELYGLSSLETNCLELASTLHDIGKIGIPDSILLKPGKLTDEEYTIMKTHTEIGYNILSSMKRKLLKYAGIIAYEHHERWDGNGYPRGLKGEDIHIFSRIVTVADVFDALAAERVYKKAWDREKILSFFEENNGKMFDPKLVDIFISHTNDFYDILNKYKDV